MEIRLGDVAPDFTATTTEGDLSFHDWKGDSWAILFSHPADFTPVCTTELGRVAALKDEFTKRDTKVLALSVDALGDHETWSNDILETQGTALNYPLIADEDQSIANAYGMIHPNQESNQTVRSVFVIGPDNTVKLTLTYPPSTGRNFDEILRVVDSLQLTANEGLATPVDWVEGDRVIVSPSISTEDARERFDNLDEVKPYLRWVDAPSK
ncbi:MAG TPA: peroxiredoxin [Nitriliruptoraceae bacterium]|nr:peroxiredoxin [Nitriliruptoraceae bacterium]